SQPELYPSSGESRCFLFLQVSTKRGASSCSGLVPSSSRIPFLNKRARRVNRPESAKLLLLTARFHRDRGASTIARDVAASLDCCLLVAKCLRNGVDSMGRRNTSSKFRGSFEG